MTQWNISPTDEAIDNRLQLTSGLQIDNNILKAIGNDGGFIDEFETLLDTNIWNDTQQATTSSGVLTFTTGGGNSYTQRWACAKARFNGKYNVKNCSVIVKIPIRNDAKDRNAYIGMSDTLNNMYYANHTRIAVRFNPYGDTSRIYMDFRTIGNSNTFDLVNPQSGFLFLKFETFVEAETVNGRMGNKMSYKFDTDADWIESGISGSFYDSIWVSSYFDADDQHFEVERIEFRGYPTDETAELPTSEAYTVAPPAKLASVDTIQPNIVTAGAGGIINLLVQHKSDEDATWVDLNGEIDQWSDLGVIDGSPISVPQYLSRTNDKFRFKLVYSGTGLVAYPEIDKITFSWSSDVTAPDEPVITTALATSESILTMLFQDLPSDAYAINFEIDINGAGSLPFSKRGKIESGYGYMDFLGQAMNVQREGEINSLLTSINGLAEGDVVTITAFARDAVGNVSAGKTKTVIMTGTQYLTMLTTIVSETIKPTIVRDAIKEIY